MHCDEARSALLDGLDDPAAAGSADLEGHLGGCAACRALSQDIQAMRARVRVWHDLDAPRRPDGAADPVRGAFVGPAPGWRSLLQQWLPLAASSLALVLALGAYREEARMPPGPAAPATEAPAAPGAADPLLTDPDLLASPAAQALLAASRRERQREMTALATLLKAELDRQKAQTEDSLEYLLAHQIRSARALDALQGQLLQSDVRTAESL